MKIRYELTETNLHLDGMSYTTYGILVRDLSTGTVCQHIQDISLDRTAVQKLMEQCNTLELSPEHLLDIVQDFVFV